MDSNSLYKTMGTNTSRIHAGSCFRPLLRFDPQAIPVCPTVGTSHCFSRHFLVLNDENYEISLLDVKKNVPLDSTPEESGFYGQDDKIFQKGSAVLTLDLPVHLHQL
jgi:hypothetical protein